MRHFQTVILLLCTLATILSTLNNLEINKGVLCPADTTRHKSLPLPELASRFPDKELHFMVNRLIMTGWWRLAYVNQKDWIKYYLTTYGAVVTYMKAGISTFYNYGGGAYNGWPDSLGGGQYAYLVYPNYLTHLS